MPMYGGHVWEIHPLVVAAPYQRHGVWPNACNRRGSSRSDTETALGLEHLHDEVADRLGNFLEPVRNSRRHHKHVALDHVMGLPPSDVRTQPLTWPRHLPPHHLAARHESRFSIEDIQYIRLFVMNFDLARGLTVSARDEQIRRGDQTSALGECGGDFIGVNMDDA